MTTADPLLDDSCCPRTAHGSLAASDKRKGSWVPIVGSIGDMYLASPPPSVPVIGAVLVIHDIFGARTGRHAQICDELAAAGFYAACPDLFGDAERRAAANLFPRWPPKGLANFCDLLCCCKASFVKASMKTSWEETVAPLLALVIAQVEERHGGGAPLRWGAVGFCWGAKPVARLLAEGAQPSVGCGIAFHPSLFGKPAAASIAAVSRPLMLCPRSRSLTVALAPRAAAPSKAPPCHCRPTGAATTRRPCSAAVRSPRTLRLRARGRAAARGPAASSRCGRCPGCCTAS